MADGVLTLDFGREERRLKVAFSEGEEKTLLPYEIHDPDWRQIDESCREILSIFNRSNRSVKFGSDDLDSLKKSGQLLFDLLLSPRAKAKLANTNAKALTLRLDDRLVHVPWELLYDGREFLCRRFAIGRLASTRQTLSAHSIRSPTAPFRVLMLADPRGDLEAAYREGLDIKTFLDQQRDIFRVDFKSQPIGIAFVKKNLRDYDIVHYAGHANYVAQNPSESGWLLSDGTLKAGEIAAMGGHRPMPALVFSNACQSGQSDEWSGDDQEQPIFGLANAFLLSGVQHYVGTFWETVDQPSSHFAKRFYTAIARGENLGKALQSARQAQVDIGGDQTLAWANYVLYGDPSRKLGMTEDTRRGEQIGWSHILRGKLAPGNAREKARYSPVLLSLIGVLLLTSLYAGFSFFQTSGSTKTEIPPSQAVRQSEITAPPVPATAPLRLGMNIIGQKREPDGSYTEVIVREGSVLHSGDHFQVHLESNRSSHVYVLLFDSQGRATQLFPDPKIEQPGFLEAQRRIAIPDKDLWFWLDDHPGTETVYALASEEPMTDIRGLLAKMEKSNEAERKRLSGEIKERIKIVERGVGGLAKGKIESTPLSEGKRVQKVTDVVAESGAVVRAISFEHR